MKKYFQITFFLGVFGILVFLKQIRGQDIVAQIPVQPTPIQSGSTPTTSNMANATPTPILTQTIMRGVYKDGSYTGSVEDAFYGNVQVQVLISNGKLTAVNFLHYPNDNRTSIRINSQATPLLSQEAITAQSAQVDGVSGASATSQAFQASLADALTQAK
jgi:uncharacterized protein with FMN-binding domain